MRQLEIITFTTSDCEEAIQVFGNCLGANPAAPYIIPVFAAAPGEFTTDLYPSSIGKTINSQYLHGIRRMADTEARVVLINLPPRAAYMGFQTYLFSEFGAPANTLLDLYLPSTQHPEASRFSVFNSISNSVNHVTIKNQLGLNEPWKQGTTAIITSADQQTINQVRTSLENARLNANRIFTEKLGFNNKMGLAQNHNDYLSLLRYALPEDQSGTDFQKNPKVEAFRVVARNRQNNNKVIRQTLDYQNAASESHLKRNLNLIVNQLRTQLSTSSGVSFISPKSLGIDSYLCEDNNRNCLGDTRDTDTYLASNAFKLNTNQIVILVGVNHNLSENSTYFAISVNDLDEIRPTPCWRSEES